MKEVDLTCSITAKEPSSIRLVLTLGIAGLISGAILVFVYQFTAPIIAANKAKATRGGNNLSTRYPRAGLGPEPSLKQS